MGFSIEFIDKKDGLVVGRLVGDLKAEDVRKYLEREDEPKGRAPLRVLVDCTDGTGEAEMDAKVLALALFRKISVRKVALYGLNGQSRSPSIEAMLAVMNLFTELEVFSDKRRAMDWLDM